MTLFNKSKNLVLCKKTRIAKGFFGKLKGLMFEKKSCFDYCLVFDLKKESGIGSSIHMFFVFFPVLVVFLSKEKRVVDKVVLKPFHPNYTPKKKARFVLEMPVEIHENIDLNDLIDWNKQKN